MSVIEAIILGIFQGIAEFLPISSSGHLVLLQKLLNVNEGNLFFTIMLHFGTLLSVVIVYYKDISNMAKEFIGLLLEILKNRKLSLNNEYRILAIMIIVGTIPTALMGMLLKDFFEVLFDSVVTVGFALLITGILLWAAEKKASGHKRTKDISIFDAIIVGTFQGLAITPGISRSGSTIVGALFRGFDKKLATRFSFLLSIPAILGASLLEFMDVISEGNQIIITLPLLIGVLLSCISGIVAIKVLVKLLEKGKLHYFSYYVWILGIITILSTTI
ncbi:undecaprenyl-diphosphate phosphatase [Caldisalinibacter kiritimatiensis]|uniref:Undecaprenyl-diphosphatase n=1 Tax=Caldisalinibacter kiritimatiensis TaxID=1304284 RepID=R1CG00_9FIRM|nr:undecaprenyl-diphosphate phosphatase [Caldisalinibacter kiritimatiensis]EOD01240.1 Undecaprenyl-diphosphatase [Caldisalinibacter kiritimatiensis]